MVSSSSNSNKQHRQGYATDNFPALNSYQVDLYIEVDQDFVTHHVNMTGAIAYVNALVTAISSIYEEEVSCGYGCSRS